MLKQIKEDIYCVFDRDPAAQSILEVITTYPGVHAIFAHRFNHCLWQLGFKWLARFSAHGTRWLTGIEIHPGAHIGRRFFIDHGMGVVIGETSVIGDDCTLYHGVTLGGTSWQKGKRHPTLGNGIVIGAGAKVLGPITIGDNVRIGSNSVVLKSVSANTTVVGIPAHVVNLEKEKVTAQRQATASKIGFDAYGTANNMPDPVAHAINHMLDHIHSVDKQLETIRRVLHDNCAELRDMPCPELEDSDIRIREDGETQKPA